MTRTNSLVRQFNVVLLGNLVAGGSTSPGVNKYEATLTAYMPETFTVQLIAAHVEVQREVDGVHRVRGVNGWPAN